MFTSSYSQRHSFSSFLLVCLHQVNNGVHFVEEEPILLCNMVRLLAAENQLSEFSLLFRHTFMLRNKVAQS